MTNPTSVTPRRSFAKRMGRTDGAHQLQGVLNPLLDTPTTMNFISQTLRRTTSEAPDAPWGQEPTLSYRGGHAVNTSQTFMNLRSG